MISAAARTAVVADGSKIGRVHLGHVTSTNAVDVLITDPTAPGAALAELRALDRLRVVVT